jgi:hypothetical protein
VNDRRIAAVALSCILVVALAVRLQPLIGNPETANGGLGRFGDTGLYAAVAANLAAGKGFTAPVVRPTSAGTPAPAVDQPVITRGPVYPFFLSLVLRLTEGLPGIERLHAARLTQAVLDALNCLAVFAIARAIYPHSFGSALLAALLAATCPYNVYYTRALLKESVATSLLTWTMAAVALAVRHAAVVWGVLGGAAAGLLALCTPQFLPWGPLAAGAIVLARRRAGGGRATAAALVVAWVAVVTPWTARNYAVFGRFIPVSTGDLGYSLYIGTFESNTNWIGWNVFPPEVFANDAERRAVLAQRDWFLSATAIGSIEATKADRFFRRLAFERFSADPLGMLVLGLTRLPRLWFQLYIPMYAEREASGAYFLVYLAFAVGALVIAAPDTRRRMLPIVALFLFQNAVYLPLHVEPRQATPVIPSILALSGIGAYVTAVKVTSVLRRRPSGT